MGYIFIVISYVFFFNCLLCDSVCFQVFIVAEVSAIPFLLWESSPAL